MKEEYKSRHFCKSVNCLIQQTLDITSIEETKNDMKERHCKKCKAYQFHQYLKENNYKIERESNV